MLTHRPIRTVWNHLGGSLPLLEDSNTGHTSLKEDDIIVSVKDEVVSVLGIGGAVVSTPDDLEALKRSVAKKYPNGKVVYIAQLLISRRVFSLLPDKPRLLAEDWRTSGFWEFPLSYGNNA